MGRLLTIIPGHGDLIVIPDSETLLRVIRQRGLVNLGLGNQTYPLILEDRGAESVVHDPSFLNKFLTRQVEAVVFAKMKVEEK